MKSDKKLSKKMKSMDDRNIDIVATATKLEEYELLYRQLRDLVYLKERRSNSYDMGKHPKRIF